MCQKPFCASVKTLAFDNTGRTSSIVGNGYAFLFNVLFNGLGSMHSLSLPFFFVATTMADIYSVGQSTLVMIFMLDNL